MSKNTNTSNSNNFKLISSKNNVNKSKLDSSVTSNNINNIKKDNKQQFNQYLQQQSQLSQRNNRTLSTQKKESYSKDKIDIKKQPIKKINTIATTNSSTERQSNKQRTLSSTSRISTVSPQSRTKPLNLKTSFQQQQQQQQQQQNNSNQQTTPKTTTKKNLFISSNQKSIKNNESIINKMKPNYDKGKILPFKQESPPIKLQKQDTNTISTQSILSRGSKQSLSVHKSITVNKMEALNGIQRSKTPENKNLQNNALSCLVRPIFKGSKYYQTSLIHFYYDYVKNQNSPYKLYFELEYSTIQLKEYFKDIFQTHFQQTYNCLQYCKRFTQNMKQNIKIQYLPQQTQQKKILVFDLDETLIHCNDNNDDPTDHTIMVTLPNEGPVETRINIRPYCQQMLRLLSNHFELMLFTASYQYYADKVLELIDPDRKLFQYRFYRDSCIEVEDNLFVKDLRVIGNRKLEDILLIDNASYSYCYQIDHGIPIIPFYDNKYDKELIFLTDYLMELKKYQSWTYSNKVHFRTYLYQQCTNLDECLREMYKTHEIKDY